MEQKKKPRGFQAMSKERRTEIARMGGKKAQELGTAHRWNSEEASAAGKKASDSRIATKDSQGND